MKGATAGFLSIILFFSLPVMLPFFSSGVFPTHDGEWAIVRLAEMHREIKDLQIPPQWAGYLNHGYGYPLFLFTYPFPYYAAEFLHVLGFSFVNAIKIIFMISIFASGAGMFFLTRRWWGNGGGLISAIMYIYVPYRFVNLYVRGSLGESLASAFFPFLVLLFERIFYERSQMSLVLLPIVFAGFLMTHNAMSVLFLPFMLAWMGFRFASEKKVKKRFFPTVLSFGIGLAMSAFFWLPALIEKKYIVLSVNPLTDKNDYFILISQLLSSTWHFNLIPPLPIGIIQLVWVVIGTLCLFMFSGDIKLKKQVLMLCVLTLVSIFFLFRQSLIFWQLPLLKEIDFPWRMLAVSMFWLTAASGSVFKLKAVAPIVIIGLVVVVLFNLRFIKTQPNRVTSDSYYATNDATTTSADELMPIWAVQKPKNRPTQKIEFSSINSRALNIVDRSNLLTFSVANTEKAFPVQATVNTLFFPGWKLFVNGVEKHISIAPATGLISFPVGMGESRVELKFADTTIRLFSKLLSLIGTVGLFILCGYTLRKSFQY